jgi:hypothetical protein
MITALDLLCYADSASGEELDSFQKGPLGRMAAEPPPRT